ncbi:unnamed protein product, partial [Discosporangium mesarthrocarpum]
KGERGKGPGVEAADPTAAGEWVGARAGVEREAMEEDGKRFVKASVPVPKILLSSGAGGSVLGNKGNTLGRRGNTQPNSKIEVALTSRSAPAKPGAAAATGRPSWHPLQLGTRSVLRPGGRSGEGVQISPMVRSDLMNGVRAFKLSQRGLDDALAETIQCKQFEWGSNIALMIQAFKVEDAKVGPTGTFSVAELLRQQVEIKRKEKTTGALRQSAWFPHMLEKLQPTVEVHGMPPCNVRLAAALYKVMVSGFEVTLPLFWSLVLASFSQVQYFPCAILNVSP